MRKNTGGKPALLHSTTFGTTIMLSRRAGALRSAASTESPGRAMSSAQLLVLAREVPGGPRRGKAASRAGGLSKRELEVARLVASGMTSRAIAERLFLSERTVESHLEHILTKLGFNSRVQVAGWVAEHLRGANADA
jgi:non-specific serine/threonine protein kinase